MMIIVHKKQIILFFVFELDTTISHFYKYKNILLNMNVLYFRKRWRFYQNSFWKLALVEIYACRILFALSHKINAERAEQK